MPETSPSPTSSRIPASVRDASDRFRRLLAPVFFIAGFLWDLLTLTRIDRLIDNLIFLAYLTALGSLIVLHARATLGHAPPFLRRLSPYLPWMMQFLFGSLFSGYVIYYFGSMSLTSSALFFLLLVALLITNEFMERRMANVNMTLTLFTFCLFTFLAFFIPVVTGIMNRWIFLLAAALTLAVAILLVRQLWPLAPRCSTKDAMRLMAPPLGVWLVMMSLYFTNNLPPVPLSLKDGGIYREVSRVGGEYIMVYEKPPLYRFWKKTTDPFHFQPGDRVYCFSAIFAPVRLKKQVFHHWQVQQGGRWTSAGRTGFGITGGRDAGYRGYTFRRNIQPGKWRVDVETQEGQVLGRIPFTVEAGEPGPTGTLTR